MLTPGATYGGPLDFLVDLGLAPHPAARDDQPRPHRRLLDPHALVGRPRRGPRTTSRRRGPRVSRTGRSSARTPSPNALLPAVTLIAINLGYVVGGAITAEIVFNWPGLGTLTVDALNARDYPVLQGIFLFLSVSVVLANFAADIVYGYLDPRVRR